MSRTSLRVLSSPDAIGEDLATRLLDRIETARRSGNRFLLGCPTGRTPRPIYNAIAGQLAKTRQDISGLVLVMMDEYLVPDDGRFKYADTRNPWSSHHFTSAEIADRWNEVLAPTERLRHESIWFPDPRDPGAHEGRISDAGGIDFFILASGASDGHVAFNAPGSARHSRTRIIELSDMTRRDNLQTFPAFGALANVPTHGVSVGIDTIASAKESVMVVWGAGKGATLNRILAARCYEPEWPATVIHECPVREIVSDDDAATAASTSDSVEGDRNRELR